MTVNPYGTRLSPRYVLMAVVQHLGGADSGHYITYRRKPCHMQMAADMHESQWVQISDDKIWDVPLKTVLAAEAYLLFYMRLDKIGEGQNRTGKDLRFSYVLTDALLEVTAGSATA